jgi:protein required for attachment to host cells
MLPVRMRIVVASQAEARFYDTSRSDGELALATQLADPGARLHDRDFGSDKPGRVFDRASTPGKRRGAVGHHATGCESRLRKHEAQLFAHRIAAALEEAHCTKSFDRVILMAAPAFLGLLRQALPPAVKQIVAAEIGKDLVHRRKLATRAHIPANVFTGRA